MTIPDYALRAMTRGITSDHQRRLAAFDAQAYNAVLSGDTAGLARIAKQKDAYMADLDTWRHMKTADKLSHHDGRTTTTVVTEEIKHPFHRTTVKAGDMVQYDASDTPTRLPKVSVDIKIIAKPDGLLDRFTRRFRDKTETVGTKRNGAPTMDCRSDTLARRQARRAARAERRVAAAV